MCINMLVDKEIEYIAVFFLLTSLYIVLYNQVFLQTRPFARSDTWPTQGQHNVTISMNTDRLDSEGTNSSNRSRPTPSTHASMKLTLNESARLQASTPLDDVRNSYVKLRDKDTNIDFRCSTCAIVASSGHVLGSLKGEEIDSKECVFRMNNAPSEGYERDVGRKTSIRVLAFATFNGNAEDIIKIFKPHSSGITYIVWGPWKLMKPGNRNVVKIIRFANRTKGNWLLFDRKKMKQMDILYEKETGESRLGSGAWLSTGWFTLNVAKDICDEIHVYGMPPDTYCRKSPTSKVPYHYYNPEGPTQCGYYKYNQRLRRGHRFLREKNIFRGWAKKYKIHFHAPKW